ncbi:MAG TPA: alpha/beta hydrolase [Pyrinomonadaceae bacterium]|nr:alpha/beta hydrolase [Pyrinomonadaceae bacterium]
MPSIQSKAINVLLRLMRMKRTVNRMRQRVESGDRTYTEPSKRLHRKYLIAKRTINSHLVWTISPKQNASEKHVIYLHGGAYVNSFAPQHWDFMSKLVDMLRCTVTAPNYPHAPEHHVNDVFALMLPLYNELVANAGSANITIMGDSSGGGISLALAQRLREDGHAQPGHVVLLSPWLDATLSNPEIAEFDKIDPFLGVEGLKYGGAVYARDVDPKSYLVSPVYGSLKDLAPVTLFIGTRDILYPDCRKLRDKAATEGVRLDYREYDQMVHNWMLGPMPEAKHAIAAIVETISPNGRR